jgi:anti-anti-sigma factor
MNTIVKIECELDAASVRESMAFFEELAADPSDVVLDMRSVGSLDGSGLGALLHVFKRKRARGEKLSLANVNGQPRQLLSELKVLPLLEYTGDSAVIETKLRLTLSTSSLPKLPGDTIVPMR